MRSTSISPLKAHGDAAVPVSGTTAAVAAAPPASSSEAAVQAGIDALAAAAASAPAATPTTTAAEPAPSPNATPTPAPAACGRPDTPRDESPGAASPASLESSPAAAAALEPAAEPTQTPDADAAAPHQSCPPRDGRPLPPAPTDVSGDRVTAVGDSVMLASAGGLLSALPGVQIDAAVSRSMWAGTGIVESLAAQGTLREFVVVGLGTNGPVDAGALQEVYDALGPSRSLVLVTAFAPRDWIPGVNAELTTFASTHPRVVIADWSGAISPHTDMLAGDQIHPGPTGGSVYATTVADAIDTVENQRAEARYQVELIRWATTRAFAPAP